MVVVKRLDPEYPRLGYEIQKGFVVDMPRGDGKAEITEKEDGTLTLSERDSKYSVSLKNVQLSEFMTLGTLGNFLEKSGYAVGYIG